MDSSRAFAFSSYEFYGGQEPLQLPPQTLPMQEMIGLCQSMRDATSPSANRNPAICFTGSCNGESIGTVTFEAALTAATQVNLQTLLIDAFASPKGSRKPLLAGLGTTLQYALKTNSSVDDAIVKVHGADLSYSCISQTGHVETVLSILPSLKKLFEKLRSSYDFIIINAGSVTGGALVPELVKLSNGAVMVIEAERTRAPVALRTKNIIEASGGKVIGAVLGNRRHYIPSALYRWL